MFKPGEIAETKDGQKVTVLSGPPAASKAKWPVNTSAGVLDENDLFMAHPTVLATANPKPRVFEERKETEETKKARDEYLAQVGLMAKFQKILAKATIEWNGHWKNGSAIHEGFRKALLKDAYLGPGAMTKENAEAILKAPENLLDRWVPVHLTDFRMSLRDCTCCGEGAFAFETNGKVVRIVGAPCKFPDGLLPNEWELNVPSGKLVVANDLRKLFPLAEDADFDVNTNLGCRQTASAYAAIGLSHAFVGNTCPGVFRCKNGTYKIASEPSEDRWDNEKKEYVLLDPKPEFDGERVAGICTDLWWYSICDHDEFTRRCKRFKPRKRDFGIKIVDVEPGVYRFRHNDWKEDDASGETIYTWFEWIRPPDPVKDFIAAYEDADVNPHAYVQAQAVRWPSLYGKVKRRGGRKDEPVSWAELTEEERLFAWRRVADDIFYVLGGGVDWHEKGFPTATVDPSIPDVEPPSFREQYHWYPFSKPYGGLFESKVFTPSFAKLAFRVLESVISFGTDVRDGEHSREVTYVRQRMLLAVERYRELMRQYPGQADPEYVAWLSQEGRAEAWVANFNLGPEFTEKHRKHAEKQRWVPEDAYAVEFDARKLKEGHFAWHPKKGGSWASKENAQRYAILEWADNKQAPEHNCFWACHATNTSIPLYTVARVTKVGNVSHMGKTLVEIVFDYGTSWMLNTGKRKAVNEAEEKAGLRVLTKEEYEALLPKAVQFFEAAEAEVGAE